MLFKIIFRTGIVILILILSYGIYYAWRAFPIISGFGAKALCSCALIEGRNPEDVIKNELASPSILKLGSFSINLTDSSVTGSVFGLAKRKAIFRKGLGCTLIAGTTEDFVRSQKISVPPKPSLNPDTISWPMGDSLPGVVPEGIDMAKLNLILDSTMLDQKNRRVRAVLVLYEGQLVAEKYAPGFSKNSKHQGWSMNKSINSALVGILSRQDRLNVVEPAPIKTWRDDERKV
ncbi:MAG: hypothetical protein L0Y35_05930, partial [Flammeovirgaceae bacterium]|nr:hypothetical protein [Flammeovirgaceae bacterium]